MKTNSEQTTGKSASSFCFSFGSSFVIYFCSLSVSFVNLFVRVLKTGGILTAAVICNLLLGCSSTKVAYNLADDYIVWQADDYFDLDSTQKKNIRTESRAGLEHLRKDSFTKFSSFLLETRDLLAKNQSSPKQLEAQLAERAEALHTLVNESLVSLAPHVSTMADDLTLENWKHFRKEFDKKTANLTTKGFNPNKYVEKLKDWIPLTKNQTMDLVRWLKENPLPYDLLIANRRHLLSVFEKESDLATGQLNKEKIRNTISRWSEIYQAQQLPEYKSAMEEHRKSWFRALAEMTYTTEQKRKFVSRLEERAEDLSSLAGRE